jgi:hypothetical protein
VWWFEEERHVFLFFSFLLCKSLYPIVALAQAAVENAARQMLKNRKGEKQNARRKRRLLRVERPNDAPLFVASHLTTLKWVGIVEIQREGV